MKQGLIIFFLFLFSEVFSQSLEIRNPIRFLALGDSYTIGQGVPETDRWPNQLVEVLNNNGIEIEVLSIIARTGWRTDNLQYAINSQKPDSSYNLVSLLIGVNNQYQGINTTVYPVEFQELLENAIALCKGNKKGVFVLSIPDYGYTPFGINNQETISAEIDIYNNINREIAEELGVVYFDITPISREAIDKPEYLASDNLHPSGEMYARWVELILSSSKLDIETSNILDHAHIKKGRVFPNPATSQLTISTHQSNCVVVVYNSVGEVVWQTSLTSDKYIDIDVSAWGRGMYFYHIRIHNKALHSGKFVLE